MSSDKRHDTVTAVLSNIRSLRAYARELDFEFLRDVSDKIQVIVSEREHEYNQEQLKKQEELEKIEKVKNFMVEIGLDPDLLSTTLNSVTHKKSGRNYRPVVPPKYRIEDSEGTHEWSGRGKPPAAFKAAFDLGNNKENYLIEKKTE